MIRGDFLNKTEAQLNKMPPKISMKMSEADWEVFDKYMENEYDGSDGFRSQCIDAGYYLLKLYPVYHQGWEMDEWGAIGEKDGVQYRLETNHGSLVPTELKKISWSLKSIKLLFFGDDDE